MANKFVRKTGSDSNNGNSAALAYLTIGKAQTVVAAGDTVYVGAGVYRELVTLTTAGSSGSPIQWIADIDGSQTGDAGLVIITARASESADPTRASCIDLAYKNWNQFTHFVLDCGTGPTVKSVGATVGNFEGVAFTGCSFLAGDSDCFSIDYNAVATAPSPGLRLTDCIFTTYAICVDIAVDENATGAVNVDCVIDGCVFISRTTGVVIVTNATTTFKPGGFKINNCTFHLGGQGISAQSMNDATTPAVSVHNCHFGSTSQGIQRSAGTSGCVVEDNNTFGGMVSAALAGVTAGGTSDQSIGGHMVGGLADLPFRRVFGFSPWAPWEPIVLADGTKMHGGVDRIASATYLPANGTDLYGNPRPMGRNAYDTGAVEARARPQLTTSGARTGSRATLLKGQGYSEFFVPVAASSTTISVYAARDGNYTGSQPILRVLNIPGVADQSAAMSGGTGANTYEQLSVTFTPTAVGICRVRVESRDTSSNGETRFDDLVVS